MIKDIIEAFFDGLNKLINGAEHLGTFSATGVWAFITLILLGYIFWNIKKQSDMSEKTLEARVKDAESDILLSKAVENGFQNLSSKVDDVKDEVIRLGDNQRNV